MKSMIAYSWEVRDEYFELLKNIPKEELSKEKNAGVGSILKTLFHVIDVEYSWFRAMNKEIDIEIQFEDFNDLQLLKELSNQYRIELSEYVENWSHIEENEIVKASWKNETFTKGEIFRHIIAHEIHHIGQLSVWLRELDHKPASSNFIGRNIGIQSI